MSPACHEFREGLHDPLDATANAHVRACEDCAFWVKRVERATRSVAALERLAPPAELEGRVVAAMEAGVREERAVRAVRNLRRVPLAPALDDAVEARTLATAMGVDTSRVPVPSVLERLVQEELANPERARVERFVSSLSRGRAPSELEARVHADMLERTRGPGVGSRRGRWLALLGSALAAGLLVTLVARPFFVVEPSDASRPFQIEAASLEDLDSMDPMARGLVESLGGGAVAAWRNR